MSSGPVTYLSPDSSDLCQRCSEERAVVLSRKEKFCAKCFVFFMRGKQRKLMQDERYKVKYGAIAERLGVQNVLLPLSYGASSLVLFDMVASLLQEQNLAHKGKQGFELVVLHLLEPKFLNSSAKRDEDLAFIQLASRYLPVNIAYHEVDLNKYIIDPVLALSVSNQFEVFAKELKNTHSQSVSDFLQQCATRSLQEDLLNVFKSEIIKHFATKVSCNTIIYGHSLTRLANEVISLTVKGRGLTIHDSVINKTIKYHNSELQIIFPLRDILKAEVLAIFLFDEFLQRFLQQEDKPGSRLAKNMTVLDLTTQYFDNLDATGYVSTSSTVVKTAEKLGGPKEPEQGKCEVCGCSIHHQPQKWLSDITVSAAAPLVTEQEEMYATAYPDPDFEGSGERLQVCYGCTVTLAGSGKGFSWPVRASKKEILDEFTFSDDESDEKQ